MTHELRLTPQAEAGLSAIAEYVREHSPAGAAKVRAGILKALEILGTFPNSGRIQTVEGVRKAVTARYRYLLYDTVNEGPEEIAILTIQHPAQERPFADDTM